MTRMQLCPTNKTVYADAASAWRRLCEIRAEYRQHEATYRTRKRCPKRIYQCEQCGWWHLTSADKLVSP